MTPIANRANPTANKVMRNPHKINKIAHKVGLRWANDIVCVRMS